MVELLRLTMTIPLLARDRP